MKGIVRKAGCAKKPVWFFETEHLNKTFVGENLARQMISEGKTVLRG
jgi:hypothetical protein